MMEETRGLLGRQPPGHQGILLFNKNRDRNESETVHFNESPAIATTSEERVVVGSQAMGFRKPVSGDRVRPVIPQLNGKSSVYGAVFIVINAAFGAGLLAFPYSFFLAGGKDSLVGGIVIEVVSQQWLREPGGRLITHVLKVLHNTKYTS